MATDPRLVEPITDPFLVTVSQSLAAKAGLDPFATDSVVVGSTPITDPGGSGESLDIENRPIWHNFVIGADEQLEPIRDYLNIASPKIFARDDTGSYGLGGSQLNWANLSVITVQNEDPDSIYSYTTTGLRVADAGVYRFTFDCYATTVSRGVWVGRNANRISRDTNSDNLPSFLTLQVVDRMNANDEFRIRRTGGGTHTINRLSWSIQKLSD